MVKIVNGNLLDATEYIIGHQVNCQGVMGSGCAKQIKEKYYEAYSEYKEYCHFIGDRSLLLGECHVVRMRDGKFVANIFGQFNYGRDTNRVYTSYPALKKALVELVNIAKAYGNLSIALPYRIGCGFANGDWDGVVYPMLQEVFADYDVTLYRYEG